METRQFDAKQAIRDIHAARVVALDLAKRLSNDAEKIAGLRAVLIKAAEKARRRQVQHSNKLTLAINAAENVSPANASAYVPALSEFARAADVLVTTLKGSTDSEAICVLATLDRGELRLREFAKEFKRTCEIAEIAAGRNESFAKTLAAALAVVEAA